MDPEDTDDDFDELDENFEEQEAPEGEEPEEEVPLGEEPEGEVEAEPVRKPSRAQARIEALDREVREAREREAVLQRQIEEIRSGQTRTTQAEAERQERERIERMDPVERAEYLARTVETRTNQRLDVLNRQIADSTDRAEFAEACASNPALAKVKDQVEAELRKLREGNVNVPRQTLAAYIIGNQVLAKAPKARERAAKKAAANIDRERTRPAGGASDAPRGGRDTSDKAQRDKRLEDYTF